MLYFNRLGLLIFLAAFGAASGIGWALDRMSEGPIMMIAGPLITLLDGGYRLTLRLPLFRRAAAGGTILFLPAWLWGIFWTGLGAWYAFGR